MRTVLVAAVLALAAIASALPQFGEVAHCECMFSQKSYKVLMINTHRYSRNETRTGTRFYATMAPVAKL